VKYDACVKLAAVAILALACHASPRGGDDARFDVPTDVGRLVIDDRAFETWAAKVRPTLETIANPQAQFIVAMLDALDERWQDAIAKLDNIAAHDPDEATRELRGLTIRAWADGGRGSFRQRFAAHVDRLPRSVRRDLSELRAMANLLTPTRCREIVEQQVGSKYGGVTLADVHVIVFQRYAVVRIVPVADDIDEVLGASGVDLPDGVTPK
jgi:hypothetical protein